MKKLLGILVLGIGIVLFIPDKTFAACDLELSTAATARYQCDDGDTMTITSDGSIERIWTNIDAGHESKNGTATTGVTINNAGTIYARESSESGTGKYAVLFDGSTNGTLINSGTISADNQRAVVAGINDDSTNYLIENLKWGTQGDNLKGKKFRVPDGMKKRYLNFVAKGIIKG